MTTRTRLICATLMLGIGATTHAQPKEVSVDVRMCWGGTSQTIVPAQGTVLGTFQLTGPFYSAAPGGAFDGAGGECVGAFESLAGELRLIGYCQLVDRQGDKAWGRDTRNKGEDFYEFLGGTGKYAGISGTLKKERPAPSAAPRPGTLTGCARMVGAYRVP